MATKIMKLTMAQALSGAQVDDNMPVNWLSTFVKKVNDATPNYQNGTVLVRGAANIWAEWTHTLSPQEELEARLAKYESIAAQVAALLPRQGEAMTAERVDKLRWALIS